MAYLALVRHGESEWNALDLWTGWTDIPLTEKGHREARAAAEALRKIQWDVAFQSDLIRSHQTLGDIKEVLGLQNIQTISSPAIKERDYGNFDGLNKVEVEEKYGRELFNKWHRGWDYPLPHGETLKDVYNRVVPFYKFNILPLLMDNKNILVSAHGNSIRALEKYLDNIPDDEVKFLEIPTGTVLLYQIDSKGKVLSKEIKSFPTL